MGPDEEQRILRKTRPLAANPHSVCDHSSHAGPVPLFMILTHRDVGVIFQIPGATSWDRRIFFTAVNGSKSCNHRPGLSFLKLSPNIDARCRGPRPWEGGTKRSHRPTRWTKAANLAYLVLRI